MCKPGHLSFIYLVLSLRMSMLAKTWWRIIKYGCDNFCVLSLSDAGCYCNLQHSIQIIPASTPLFEGCKVRKSGAQTSSDSGA
jgi:hypothetical protein